MSISGREIPEEFREAVRAAYRDYRRNRLLALGLLFGGLAIIAVSWQTSPWWITAVGVAGCLAAISVFPFRAWRCPACGETEQADEADGPQCQNCGMPFN